MRNTLFVFVMMGLMASTFDASAGGLPSASRPQMLFASPNDATVTTLSGVLASFALPTLAIPLPGGGTLGDASIGTLGNLPGLSALQIPFIGSIGSIPVVGTLSLLQGFTILDDVAALDAPLP